MNQNILDALAALPNDFHDAGVMPAVVLEAIERHSRDIKIINSVETGSGLSTILFSHLSQKHLVFAKEQFGDIQGNSISSVKGSELFHSESVEYIIGPTQRTLPNYKFTEKLQLVLIDGPHGFPYPNLEYYYLYQHLDEGALLIIDDIHIPTIRQLAEVLCEDEMFEKLEIVESCMFLKRTSAAMFNPEGDDWWLQTYNSSRYPDNSIIKPATTRGRIYQRVEKIFGKKITKSANKLAKKIVSDKLLRRL